MGLSFLLTMTKIAVRWLAKDGHNLVSERTSESMALQIIIDHRYGFTAGKGKEKREGIRRQVTHDCLPHC